jgi:hypothetical protein
MPIPIEQKLVPIAIIVRDRLLNRNLILSDTVTSYGSTAWASGIDKPAQIGLLNDNIIASTDITNDGELYRELLLLNNRYINSSSTKNNLLGITFDNSQYFKGYESNYSSIDIDNKLLLKSGNFRLNLLQNNQYRKFDEVINFENNEGYLPQYRPTTNESYIDSSGNLVSTTKFELAGNILGSALNGQGIGIGQNGLDANFDVRTTLGGRMLGMTGIIDDTPLGKYAQRGLAAAMLNNVAFNVQQEVGGMINLSPVNFLSGGDIIVPNNDITVPKDGIGKSTDLIQKLSGFEVPRSFLPEDASIFSFNDKLVLIKNDNSSQTIIDNTGEGQQIALFRNLNANLLMGWYGPSYTPSKKGIIYSGAGTNDLNYQTDSKSYLGLVDVATAGDLCDVTWPGNSGNAVLESYEYSFTKKSLLDKTQELFKGGKDRKIQTMINQLSVAERTPDEISSLINQKIQSKGNAVINTDGTFCRTWSTLKRYNTVNTLQKHRGLDNGNTNSVLDSNGFVRIGPTYGNGGQTDMKRFMFSLENLAWSDNVDLLECETGPGDGLADGKRGRIMWFPPYNLTFSDTSSVNWESTEFIGRGEPMYTYSNTERSGNLSFKIITDHSSAYNNFKNKSIDEINRFLFGCDNIPDSITSKISTVTKDAIDVAKAKTESTTTKVNDVTLNYNINYYYPNDISTFEGIFGNYEKNGEPTNQTPGSGIGKYDSPLSNEDFENKYDTGLNKEFYSKMQSYADEVNKVDNAVLKIQGYASSHGNVKNNTKLMTDRANNMKTLLMAPPYNIPAKKFKIPIGKAIESVNGITDQDAYNVKKLRRSEISIETDPSKSVLKPEETIKDEIPTNNNLNNVNTSGLLCEGSYFKYLEETDPTTYTKITESIKDQIKFFQPAFHSITPEGFNSRLNFLLQCTRQGATIGKDNGVTPSNLAFGKPPVCILRVGDFYHTKIVIDNVDFSFNEVQWDLNPDGIGVQPMIVDVTISFKFIGGSSINGPIARLQNAVSFNFFANTEMYDERADRIDNNGKLQRGKTNKTEIKPNVDVTSVDKPNINQAILNDESNSGSNSQTIQSSTDDDINVLNKLTFSTLAFEKDSDYLLITLMTNGNETVNNEHIGKIYLQNPKNGEKTLLTNDKNNIQDVTITLLPGNTITTDFQYLIYLPSSTYNIIVEWDGNSTISNKSTIQIESYN